MVENQAVGHAPQLLLAIAVGKRSASGHGEAVDDAFVGLVNVFLAIAKVEDGLFGEIGSAFVHLVSRREPYHIVEV